jgi:hypothetical protein
MRISRRILDHLYARYIVANLKQPRKGDPEAGFLKEDASEWVPAHFGAGRKGLHRRYIMMGAT